MIKYEEGTANCGVQSPLLGFNAGTSITPYPPWSEMFFYQQVAIVFADSRNIARNPIHKRVREEPPGVQLSFALHLKKKALDSNWATSSGGDPARISKFLFMSNTEEFIRHLELKYLVNKFGGFQPWRFGEL